MARAAASSESGPMSLKLIESADEPCAHLLAVVAAVGIGVEFETRCVTRL